MRLLGGLLGRVLEEAGGPGLLEDVERLRRATIALRAADGGRRQARARVVELVAGFDQDRAELLARAFTVYFQLVNLAEEQHRVRTLRERRQQGGQVRESFEAAVAEVRDAAGEDGLARLLDRLEVAPVLTAHPTEARRRAVVDALRRIAVELARLDAPRLPGDDQATATRRLLEEITGLWRTAQLRRDRPSPLDEVRSVMAVFDATLFRLVPATYRALEQAVSGEAAGTGPPPFPAYLHWGSWVGGDRDGNPSVTAETTRTAMAIQADHVLRGLERGHQAGRPRPDRRPAARPRRRRSCSPPSTATPPPSRARPPPSPPAGRTSPTSRSCCWRPSGWPPPAPPCSAAVPRAGPAVVTGTRASSWPTCAWSRRRWPRPGRPGWPTGSFSTWPGRPRRSASTWPPWRSASTPPSTPRPWPSWPPGPPATPPPSTGWPSRAGDLSASLGTASPPRCWRPCG